MIEVEWDALQEAAADAMSRAYAPYSRIQVGCAILSGGKIFSGCNVENASYPVGSCAERGAIAAMVAGGERRIDAAVIVSEDGIPPCGMCRQALVEFGRGIPVRIYGKGGFRESSLEDLLPEPFRM